MQPTSCLTILIALFCFSTTKGQNYNQLVQGVDTFWTGGAPGLVLPSSTTARNIIAGHPVTSTCPSTVVVANQDNSNSGRSLAICHDGAFINTNVGRFDNPRFVANSMNWLDKDGRKLVLMTGGHGEFFKESNSDDFKQILNSNGFSLIYKNGTLEESDLLGIGVLVIGNAWNAFTDEEYEVIENFYKTGGGLLIFGLGWSFNAYRDEPFNEYPMNVIGSFCGLYFSKRGINDPVNFATEIIGNPTQSPLFLSFYPNTQHSQGSCDADDIECDEKLIIEISDVRNSNNRDNGNRIGVDDPWQTEAIQNNLVLIHDFGQQNDFTVRCIPQHNPYGNKARVKLYTRRTITHYEIDLIARRAKRESVIHDVPINSDDIDLNYTARDASSFFRVSVPNTPVSVEISKIEPVFLSFGVDENMDGSLSKKEYHHTYTVHSISQNTYAKNLVQLALIEEGLKIKNGIDILGPQECEGINVNIIKKFRTGNWSQNHNPDQITPTSISTNISAPNVNPYNGATLTHNFGAEDFDFSYRKTFEDELLDCESSAVFRAGLPVEIWNSDSWKSDCIANADETKSAIKRFVQSLSYEDLLNAYDNSDDNGDKRKSKFRNPDLAFDYGFIGDIGLGNASPKKEDFDIVLTLEKKNNKMKIFPEVVIDNMKVLDLWDYNYFNTAARGIPRIPATVQAGQDLFPFGKIFFQEFEIDQEIKITDCKGAGGLFDDLFSLGSDCNNHLIEDVARTTTLELKVFLEGLYDRSTNSMRSEPLYRGDLFDVKLKDYINNCPQKNDITELLNDASLNYINEPWVDYLIVSLHDKDERHKIHKSRLVLLKADGSTIPAKIDFNLSDDDNNEYYISISHHSHLDAITDEAITFPRFDVLDLTKRNMFNGSVSQLKSNVYGLSAGDCDQDGVITRSDNITELPDGSRILGPECDLDGNGRITHRDISLAERNEGKSNNSITSCQ